MKCCSSYAAILILISCFNFLFGSAESRRQQDIAAFVERHITFRARIEDFITDIKLTSVLQNNVDYRSRFPFPYAVLDGLFPMDVIEAVEGEIPDAPKLKPDGCVENSQRCFYDHDQNLKNAFNDELYFGPATLAVFRVLKSEVFTNFLEKLTGIDNLIPDPAYLGSGIHQTLSGGKLNIHADFNRYEKFDMHRRVNVFLFLNTNWDESYGGQLELWSKDLKSCGAKINPDLGRFVVFSSTDFSYHGHPHELTCPPDRSRRSLALYYYSSNRPAEECLNSACYSGHSTLFQYPLCSQCDEECAHLPGKLIPEGILG